MHGYEFDQQSGHNKHLGGGEGGAGRAKQTMNKQIVSAVVANVLRNEELAREMALQSLQRRIYDAKYGEGSYYEDQPLVPTKDSMKIWEEKIKASFTEAKETMPKYLSDWWKLCEKRDQKQHTHLPEGNK